MSGRRGGGRMIGGRKGRGRGGRNADGWEGGRVDDVDGGAGRRTERAEESTWTGEGKSGKRRQ